MANFETHFQSSIITSAAFSSTVLATSLANPLDTFILFIIGSLSGLLPDLDADKSRSLNSLFSVLSLCAAIGLPLMIKFDSLLTLWGSALCVYTVLMHIVKPLFESLTVHRGAMHSLLFVLMCSLISIHLALLLGKSLSFSVLLSLSVGIGMLTHLILDECYSVDISNNEIKASFGSALKPIALGAPWASLIQLCIIGGALYLLVPYKEKLLTVVQSWQYKLAAVPLMPNLEALKIWV
ncbi:metal-dependent hydrolase [Pseudoalteromonas sp. JBTF-M23]|uniref:Metal-dependent hydrolase n=1 Tax=Pseudoalteromonas caenipelagi TaxID=2726988 RepID=A0A849V6K2_9GAMM|nr:metal-dependent hydrolase [Pseudoalteromonas caenipelagi]NOU48932.1 metal-dependent hydrolase [Pseudoalteromonas caenipelagi]